MKLREFVELSARRLEFVFRAQGGLLIPMFHAITRDGEQFTLPGDLADDKDRMCALARAVFKRFDVTRYLFVDEAWTVVATSEAAFREVVRVGTNRHPARKEIVMISAEDEAEGQLCASRMIIRPATGPAHLGPLEIDDLTTVSEGRFVGLLPRPTRTKVH